MSDQNTLPPAAWYADPQDPQALRFWDGAAWTDQTRPLVPEPVAPQPAAPAPAVAQPAAPQPVAPEPAIAVEPVVAQPAVAEPVVAEVITPQPAIQETVGYTAAGPAVTETVVDQSLGYQAVAEPVVPVVAEPAVADPLYSGFAAEVAGLSDSAVAAEASATVVDVADDSGDVVIVTTESVPGLSVARVVGAVMGVAVRPHSELSDVSGFGGFGPADQAGLMLSTRSDALARLSQAAAEAGGNAVVGVRIDASDVAGTFTEVVAYGTAVVTSPA